jgi:hypothetical protein
MASLAEMGITNTDPVYWRNLAKRLNYLLAQHAESEAEWQKKEAERRKSETQLRIAQDLR